MDMDAVSNVTGNTAVVSGIQVVHPAFRILCMMLSAWILTSNSVILICFLSNQSRQWTSYMTQLASLSLNDFVQGLLIVPFFVFPFLDRSHEISFKFCSSVFYIFFASQTATLYHIFGICVYRFMIVVQANSIDAQRVSRRTAVVLVSAAWVASFSVTAVPMFVFSGNLGTIPNCHIRALFVPESYRQAINIIGFLNLVPLVLTNILYIITCIKLVNQWKKVSPSHSLFPTAAILSIDNIAGRSLPGQSVELEDLQAKWHRAKANIGAQRTVVGTIGIIVLLLNIFTLPLVIGCLVEGNSVDTFISRNVKFVICIVFALNSSFNPFIYTARSKPLRKALKAMFMDCWRFINDTTL